MIFVLILLNTLMLLLNVVNPHRAENQAAIAFVVYILTSFIMLAVSRMLRGSTGLARATIVLGLEGVVLYGIIVVPFDAVMRMRDYAEGTTSVSDLKDRPLLINGQPAGIEVTFQFVPKGFLWIRDAYSPIGRLEFEVSPPKVDGRPVPGNYLIGLDPREIEVTPPVPHGNPYAADTTYEVRATAVPHFLQSVGDSFCLTAEFDLNRIERDWKAITEEGGAVQFSVVFERVDPPESSYSNALRLRTEGRYDLTGLYAAALSLSEGRRCPPNTHSGAASPF